MVSEMKYLTKYIILSILSVVVLINSCEKPVESVIEPDPPDPPDLPLKDPRQYVWTADTISYENSLQLSMRTICKISPDDIYIGGHNSVNEGNFWHFNGEVWKNIDLREDIELMAHSFRKIYGFSVDNVWAVGKQTIFHPIIQNTLLRNAPLIIHYDGVKWEKHNLASFNGLWSIHGDSPNNLWVCGTGGLVAHYNGFEWIEDTVRVPDQREGNLEISDITVYNNNVYLVATLHRPDGTGSFNSIRGEIDNWEVIDSFNYNEQPSFGDMYLYASPDGYLFSSPTKVYRFENGLWNIFLDQFGPYNPAKELMGPSQNDLIINAYDGVYHWNGSDLYRFPEVNPHGTHHIWTVWYDGREAFLVGVNKTGVPMKTVIWHGK